MGETCNRDHKCDAYRLYRRIESDFDICITCMYVKFLEHYRKEIYFVHNVFEFNNVLKVYPYHDKLQNL